MASMYWENVALEKCKPPPAALPPQCLLVTTRVCLSNCGESCHSASQVTAASFLG